MEFVERLEYFRRWRRETYGRGFVHGFLACAAGVAFFALYWYVGGAP